MAAKSYPDSNTTPTSSRRCLAPVAVEQIWRFGASTADMVFELIARHQLKVPTTRAGWLQGIHSEKAAIRARRRAAQWQRRGANVDYLDAAETRAIAGTGGYVGGVIDRRGGALQPLSFARELARLAGAAGANIYGSTQVERITKASRGWTLTTAKGASVHAKAVLICTNGYSGRAHSRSEKFNHRRQFTADCD